MASAARKTSVGRKREGQPKEVRNTPAGKFGRHLEQLVEAAGLSTSEFAEKIGVTPDAVRKYFRGTQLPVMNRWPRIAKVLRLKNAKDLLPDMPAE